MAKQNSKTNDLPFLPPQWPATKIELWSLDKIKPYAKNPRLHSKSQVEAIAASMKSDGVTMPILIDEKGLIIAGHGRRMAAEKNGYEEYPVAIARGWTESQKRAARLRDNQFGLMSTWDDNFLKFEIGHLRGLKGFDLSSLGFPESELARLESLGDHDDRGALLDLVNITIDEPKHEVKHLDRFLLSGRHHLICVSVIEDWPVWSPLLKKDSLFCPYPGVFVPFSAKAETHTLVMVQPDQYICGHILDRYQDVHGKKAIK